MWENQVQTEEVLLIILFQNMLIIYAVYNLKLDLYRNNEK